VHLKKPIKLNFSIWTLLGLTIIVALLCLPPYYKKRNNLRIRSLSAYQYSCCDELLKGMTSLRDCSRETHKFSTYPTGTKELWKWQLNVTEKATNTTVYTIAITGSVRIATNPYGWDSLRPVNISLSPGLSVEDIEDSIVVGFKKNDWNFVVESYQTPRSGEDSPPK
jgi:hypothetical protein